METDCIFLLEGREQEGEAEEKKKKEEKEGEREKKKNRKQHILSLMACRGLSQPRCAKMERFLSHASMGIFAPAGSLVNQ